MQSEQITAIMLIIIKLKVARNGNKITIQVIMATIRVFISAFSQLVIAKIDVTTFSFCGPTDNYPYPESKKYDHSIIGFVAENAHEVVKAIHETFRLNPEYSKPEDYIWVKDKFQDWEKDKRPRIGIKLPNGAQGMLNPPSFSIEADEVPKEPEYPVTSDFVPLSDMY